MQSIVVGEEQTLGRAATGDLCIECHMPVGIQRWQRVCREAGERSTARHGIAIGRDLRYVSGLDNENALASGCTQDGRVECDLATRIDWCDDWLAGNVEAIEAAAAGRCEA